MKRRDEVLVGVFITVAVAIALLGTLWLVRGGLSSGYPLYTRFAWGQNLKQGQPVLLAGVNVGDVGDVKLRDDGYLDVMLRVNDDVKVPKDSTATVKPVGIFGDAAIALTPQGAEHDLLRAGRHGAGRDRATTDIQAIMNAWTRSASTVNAHDEHAERRAGRSRAAPATSGGRWPTPPSCRRTRRGCRCSSTRSRPSRTATSR